MHLTHLRTWNILQGFLSKTSNVSSMGRQTWALLPGDMVGRGRVGTVDRYCQVEHFHKETRNLGSIGLKRIYSKETSCFQRQQLVSMVSLCFYFGSMVDWRNITQKKHRIRMTPSAMSTSIGHLGCLMKWNIFFRHFLLTSLEKLQATRAQWSLLSRLSCFSRCRGSMWSSEPDHARDWGHLGNFLTSQHFVNATLQWSIDIQLYFRLIYYIIYNYSRKSSDSSRSASIPGVLLCRDPKAAWPLKDRFPAHSVDRGDMRNM